MADKQRSIGVIFQSLNGNLDITNHLDGMWEQPEQLLDYEAREVISSSVGIASTSLRHSEYTNSYQN